MVVAHMGVREPPVEAERAGAREELARVRRPGYVYSELLAAHGGCDSTTSRLGRQRSSIHRCVPNSGSEGLQSTVLYQTVDSPGGQCRRLPLCLLHLDGGVRVAAGAAAER